MGAENAKVSTKYDNIDENTINVMSEIFKKAKINKGKMSIAQFKQSFPTIECISDHIFNRISDNDGKVNCQDLLKLCDAAFGTYDEQADVMRKAFGDDLKQIISSITKVYCHDNKCSDKDQQKLAEYLESSNRFDMDRLDKYLVECPLASNMSKYLFNKILQRTNKKTIPSMTTKSMLLSTSDVIIINSHLAMDQRRKWTLLFSSATMGASFSQMVKRVNDEGPCLVVIRSKSNKIFGFYASNGFHAGPQYHGNDTCFLFELVPNIRIYSSTGRNDKYVYLNYQQQRMPNGMGIGGYDDIWPLFIHEEFGKGICQNGSSSFEKCFVAGQKEFEIDIMEVWRVGEKPVIIGEDGEVVKSEKSIIDKDPEARAILEMSGKTMHSEAYREPEPMLDEME